MQIDMATRRNLELTRSLTGGRQGSLLDVLDRTVTAGGARLLERRVSGPATSAEDDRESVMMVWRISSNMRVRDEIRGALCASVPTSNVPCRGWRWTGVAPAI
jgi:DNA mismatch repair protein MutS